MAVGERRTDMPTLRLLRDAGGYLTIDELRPLVQKYFSEPLGQWNIISNMGGRNSLIYRGLVSRQIRYEGSDWYDFNDHLPKEGRRPDQRVALTEKGRLLLAALPSDELTVPDNFEEIISRQVSTVQENAEIATEFVSQRDEIDSDAAPAETAINRERPRSPKAGDHVFDPEARRQANARRVAGHHALVVALASKAAKADLDVSQTRYADVLVRTKGSGAIFEIKTLRRDGRRTDLVRQIRAAIAQLYHYRFIHRKSPGFEHNVGLYVVVDAEVPEDLASFLREISIGTVWYVDGAFHGDLESLERLPWLN